MKLLTLAHSPPLRWLKKYSLGCNLATPTRSPDSSIPQSQQQTGALPLPIPALPTRQIRDVRVARQRSRDVTTRLDSSDLDQPISRLGHRLTDDIGALCLALRSDNIRLSLLLGFLDDEARALSVLLRDLLLFDGAREFSAEGHVRDGDVFEGDVEFLGTAEEIGPNSVGDSFSLRY
jgi:hypothetical protein